jgi:hypothetical protein
VNQAKLDQELLKAIQYNKQGLVKRLHSEGGSPLTASSNLTVKSKTGIQRPHRRALGQALGLAITLAGVALGQAQQVPVDERTLSNGMKLLMIERHLSPADGWRASAASTSAPASPASRTSSST